MTCRAKTLSEKDPVLIDQKVFVHFKSRASRSLKIHVLGKPSSFLKWSLFVL